MIAWDQLNQDLLPVNDRYLRLRQKFFDFAKIASEAFKQPSFHIKDIEINLCLDQNYFLAKFAGRTIHFHLETAFSEGNVLVGFIHCYLREDFPESGCRLLVSLKCNGAGKTELLDNVGDPILIDSDIGSLYICLNAIHKSLGSQTQTNQPPLEVAMAQEMKS